MKRHFAQYSMVMLVDVVVMAGRWALGGGAGKKKWDVDLIGI